MIFFGSHGCGYFNIIVMEKIMKKQNQILSLAQSLEFYTNGTLPLPHHLDKERTPFFDDEEINAAKAAIRSYVEKGLLKLYGISGQIEINDVPSMDDNFLKVTPQNGKEILYPFNEWIDVETPNSYFLTTIQLVISLAQERYYRPIYRLMKLTGNTALC